jgi:hypothetical protein
MGAALILEEPKSAKNSQIFTQIVTAQTKRLDQGHIFPKTDKSIKFSTVLAKL